MRDVISIDVDELCPGLFRAKITHICPLRHGVGGAAKRTLMHPGDPHIVMLKHNVWRIKGLIQISRSIGDVYLKKAEFNREPLYPKFRLRERFKRLILSADPSISTHQLQPDDRFVIFASDGLWEHLINQEAVDLVHNHPRNVHCFYSPP